MLEEGKQQGYEILAKPLEKMPAGLISAGTDCSGGGLTAQHTLESHLPGTLITAAQSWPRTSALGCEMISVGVRRREGEWLFSWKGKLIVST